MRKIDFTLILACYNEHEHILKSVDSIINELNRSNLNWETIFIDDKSTDNTAKLLNDIKKKYSKFNITVINHPKNQGRGATVSEGIRKARGEIVGYIDIDCEISPSYMKKFIKEVKRGVDIVVAKRNYKVDIKSVFRFIASTTYAYFVNKLFSLSISDSESGYKFFNRKRILPVLEIIKDARWFWDTEIIVRAKLANLSIKEIPVLFKRRTDKTSTVKLFSDSIEYIKRLISLKLELLKNQ